MNKKLLKKIKYLCTGEIKFVSMAEKSVTVLLPYDNAEIEIEIEGVTEKDKIDSFIHGVNQKLDDMINHLEDCKL